MGYICTTYDKMDHYGKCFCARFATGPSNVCHAICAVSAITQQHAIESKYVPTMI